MAGERKPIRSDAEHTAALEEVERLWGAASVTPDGDRLAQLMLHMEEVGRVMHSQMMFDIRQQP
jgi:HTH-type transcriptional regulator/antitoxin HigA